MTQTMTHQEAMQRQAQLLLQVGELAMQLEQKQVEETALRHQLLLTRLELAHLGGYVQALRTAEESVKAQGDATS
jgi:hypothetical protein